MNTVDITPICHWLTPTRLLPSTYAAERKPWSCLAHGCPRPLSASELEQCASCPDLKPRVFESAQRDLLYQAWGGVPVPNDRPFDDVRRELVYDVWGVS